MEKLPEGWTICSLEEITVSKKGKKPNRLTKDYYEESIPYLDIKAFETNQISYYADQESSILVESNDIIVVWDGARSGWVGKGKVGALGSTLVALSPIIIDANYLYYFLQTQFQYINSNIKGSGIPHVNPEIFWNIKVPIAPLEEQKLIVEKIEELMYKVQSMQKSIAVIPDKLNLAKQKVLTAAVTGKLTEEWRQKKNSNFNFINQNASFGKKLFDVPISWQWDTFVNLCETITVGFVGSMASEYRNEGIPFLRSLNVREFRYEPKGLKYISQEFHEKLDKSKLLPGDIVIVRSGNVGISMVVPEELIEANCSDLVIVKPRAELDSYYGSIYINSAVVREYILGKKVGIAQAHFNVGAMKLTPIALPPIDEQKQIVREIESIYANINSLMNKINSLNATIDAIPSKLLQAAFSGDLIPQSLVVEDNFENVKSTIKAAKDEMLKNLKANKLMKREIKTETKVISFTEELLLKYTGSKFTFETIKTLFLKHNYRISRNEFFRLLENGKIEMQFDKDLEFFTFSLLTKEEDEIA